jgi:hypothetical protein
MPTIDMFGLGVLGVPNNDIGMPKIVKKNQTKGERRPFMKMTVILAALFIGTMAQAKTFCTINKQNPKEEMTFDQTVFSGEVQDAEMFVLKTDGSLARNFKLDSIKSEAEFRQLDKSTIISVSKQENGIYSIAVGTFDVSKIDTNALPMDAIALGSSDKILNLIAAKKGLSIACFPLSAITK